MSSTGDSCTGSAGLGSWSERAVRGAQAHQRAAAAGAAAAAAAARAGAAAPWASRARCRSSPGTTTAGTPRMPPCARCCGWPLPARAPQAAGARALGAMLAALRCAQARRARHGVCCSPSAASEAGGAGCGGGVLRMCGVRGYASSRRVREGCTCMAGWGGAGAQGQGRRRGRAARQAQAVRPGPRLAAAARPQAAH